MFQIVSQTAVRWRDGFVTRKFSLEALSKQICLHKADLWFPVYLRVLLYNAFRNSLAFAEIYSSVSNP
jgi:hypothetical protein